MNDYDAGTLVVVGGIIITSILCGVIFVAFFCLLIGVPF